MQRPSIVVAAQHAARARELTHHLGLLFPTPWSGAESPDVQDIPRYSALLPAA